MLGRVFSEAIKEGKEGLLDRSRHLDRKKLRKTQIQHKGTQLEEPPSIDLAAKSDGLYFRVISFPRIQILRT